MMKKGFIKKSIQRFKKWCEKKEKTSSQTQPTVLGEMNTKKIISLEEVKSNRTIAQTPVSTQTSLGKDTVLTVENETESQLSETLVETKEEISLDEQPTLPKSDEWVEVTPYQEPITSSKPQKHQTINKKQPGELYKKVAQIPIIDVLMFYGFYNGNKPTHGSVQIHCPLPNHIHHSTTKRKGGSMNIDLSQNKATCWSSNCSHTKVDFKNCMSLLAAIRGDKNQQYVKYLIAKDFGLISEETFNRFLNGDILKDSDIEIQESTYYAPHQTVTLFNERASEETIDLVIRALMGTFRAHCGHRNHPKYGLLSPEDFKYLHEERNLSEDFIKEGYYFTFPSEKCFPAFVEMLLRNKIIKDKSELNDLLKGVPGFYFDHATQEWSYATCDRNGEFIAPRGIGIPIQNANKKFTAIQIRKRYTPISGSKYTWHTSKYFVGEKFSYGITSGAPVSVIFPKEIKRKIIFITEGDFKARCIADTYECIVISVQGVSNFKGIEEEIKTLIHDRGLTFNHILIAYDADVASKKEVLKESRKLINHLKSELQTELEQTNLLFVGWDLRYGKGIDDVIESGNRQFLSRLHADQYLKLCDQMFNTVGTMENWTEEQRITTYNHFVLSHFPNYEYLKEQKEPA